ncbi:MAG: SDR family oxidoreductase [Gemmatimonadaceae bacterium]
MMSRIVVITGASGGIGAALARRLAFDGARLVLAARRERELEKVAAETLKLGAKDAVPVVADVTRKSDVFRIRDRALETRGRIDVWVNNAGRGITRSVLDLTDEDVDQIIAVNLKSAIYGIQAVVPHFVERGSGHLINVSSFLGRVPVASFRSIYSAAKAALNSLTANLRMDLRQYPGIHVSLVMPGVVTTDFARNVMGEARPPMNAGAPGSSTMRAQTPEEVAERIAELIKVPLAEVYTNPASAEIARRYFADVYAFEEAMPHPAARDGQTTQPSSDEARP